MSLSILNWIFVLNMIELVVDEMLAIKSEIDAGREKKASEEANAKYNEMLYYGLTGE